MMGRALHRIPALVVVAVVGLGACGGRSSLLDGIPDASVQAASKADAGVPQPGVDAAGQGARDASVRDGAREGGSGNDAGNRRDATAVEDVRADSAKDAGASDTNTGSTTGDGACARLGVCCPSIGEPLQSVCVEVAKMGNEVGCALFLQDGSSHDMCPPGRGSGVGGPACVALGVCCSMVPPGEVQACVAVANQADDSECAGAVALAQSAGMCLSGDGGSDGGGD
jgi:hypothetical protein